MLLESVPNLSEGRDREAVALVAHAGAAAGAGAWVLDEDLDRDHNRAVVSLCGSPAGLEEALVGMASAAAERLDLRAHEGVHPRVGTLDVVPLVPLAPSDMPAAIDTARAVGRRVATDLGIPVYFYGDALGGPSLADIRAGRAAPDLGGTRPHPRAGFACVGARPLLVAYNILFPGAPPGSVRTLARALRARGGPNGMPGVQALTFTVRGETPQLSMNLFDLAVAQPRLVLDEVRRRADRMGLEVGADEVVGLCPATAAGGLGAARGRVLEARMIAAGLSEAVRELGRTRGGASADLERTLVAGRLMNERARVITMGVEGEDFLSMAEAAAILPAYIRAAAVKAPAAGELLLTAARRLRAAVPDAVSARFARRIELLDRLLT